MKNYPQYICCECGERYGKWGTLKYIATFHKGVCDICKKEASITEPRDFGYLKEEWKHGQRH